jgi:hypothetical protein
MILDVLINSCARPDILDVSFRTFKERIKTKHALRYVLLEDYVEDMGRQQLGRQWVESQNFDKVVYAEKKMGPGCFFAPVVSLCESDYFFHLEDDNEFIMDINLDPTIEFMKKHDDVVEVMLSRGNKGPNVGKKVTIDGLALTEFKLFSVATGVFNTKQVKRVIDKLGWDNRLHEAGTLTPTSKQLNQKKYLLGHGEQHYVHVGQIKNYRKGTWK